MIGQVGFSSGINANMGLHMFGSIFNSFEGYLQMTTNMNSFNSFGGSVYGGTGSSGYGIGAPPMFGSLTSNYQHTTQMYDSPGAPPMFGSLTSNYPHTTQMYGSPGAPPMFGSLTTDYPGTQLMYPSAGRPPMFGNLTSDYPTTQLMYPSPGAPPLFGPLTYNYPQATQTVSVPVISIKNIRYSLKTISDIFLFNRKTEEFPTYSVNSSGGDEFGVNNYQ